MSCCINMIFRSLMQTETVVDVPLPQLMGRRCSPFRERARSTCRHRREHAAHALPSLRRHSKGRPCFGQGCCGCRQGNNVNMLPPSCREEWWWLVAPEGVRLSGSISQKCADIVAHAGCESRPHVLDSLTLMREEEGEKGRCLRVERLS